MKGVKVVVRPLSERLSLSPTPIKAALAGLERDGFLTAIPHRGSYVPQVNVQDMRDRAIWNASGNSRLAQVTDNLVGQVRFGSGSSSRLPGRIAAALHEHASRRWGVKHAYVRPKFRYFCRTEAGSTPRELRRIRGPGAVLGWS
jgi:Bacterial regulatory proteins, gntR family